MTKTKSYKTLQKKLQELEVELSLVFSLPTETTPCHHLLSEGIEQRFSFLKNLLSAEIASHPSKPRHLRHVANRLNELEIAFREWDDYRTSAAVNNFDTASVCSCDESCHNNEEEASNLPSPQDSGSFEEEAVEEKCPLALVDVKVQDQGIEKVDIEDAVENDKGRASMLRRHCRVLVSGIIMAMLLMGAAIVGYSGSSYSTPYEGVLTPT